MNYKIKGIGDRKIIIALKKLAQSFHSNIKLVDQEDAKEVYLKYRVIKDVLSVTLTCEFHEILETAKIENDYNSDLKYLILVSFYQLWMKETNIQLSYGVLNGIRPTKLVHRYKREQLSDADIVNKLMKKFSVSLEKAKLLVEVVNQEYSILPNLTKLKEEISVYIHIPFCLSKCSYCSFTSYKVDNKFVKQTEYLEKLLFEIKTLGNYIKDHRIKITTLYIGGGTPTALTDENLKLLLLQIENSLLDKDVLEYTLECGRPDSLTLTKLDIINQFSINRISINPQTFNDETLKRMNRTHTSTDIINKFNQATELGFDNINMDLIIGLPHENMDDYKQSVDEVIKLNPSSITIHNLALKKGSKLAKQELNACESEIVQAFDYSYSNLKNQGYNPYYLYRQKNSPGQLENIGYCKKSDASIYNIIMIEELQNIVGLGCGASSKFLNHELILNPKDLISYVKSYQDYLTKKMTTLEKCIVNMEDYKNE